MRIDGSSLNPFAGVQLWGNQSQSGAGIPGVPQSSDQSGSQKSSAFKINVVNYVPPPPPGLEGIFDQPKSDAPKSMTELVEELGKPESTDDMFALEMVRRMQGQVDENGEPKDASRVANALKEAIGWIREQHGEKTASAAMAMVLGSTGEGSSEQTVAGGLLSALNFIDRAHGIPAGDAAMAHFNGELNNAINDYFDNGFNEKFVAVEAGNPGLTMNAANLSSRFAREAMSASSGGIDEQSLTEKMLSEMAKELEDATDPEEMAKAKLKKAQAAYGFVASPEPELLSTSA